MSKNSTAYISIILLMLIILNGCAWDNRGLISQLAEFDGKLFIATSEGDFVSYEVKNNKFNKIKNLEGVKVTKLIPSNKILIIETSDWKRGKSTVGRTILNTYEYVYFLNKQGEFLDFIENVSPGFKQYQSSLISADDKYIYGVKNDLYPNTGFILKSFRYDTNTKEKIDNHFNRDTKLVVRDIFEDTDYCWYACMDNPQATHWITMKGPLVVIRKDKNSQKTTTIRLDSTVYEGKISINGDRNHIWVSGGGRYTPRKTGGYKISKNDLSFEPFSVVRLNYNVKESLSFAGDDYLWLLVSGNLVRFEKDSFNKTQVIIDDEKISNISPSVVDDKFVWMVICREKQGFKTEYAPLLLRVAKDDLSYKVIPITTTFGEGLSNFGASIVRNIQAFVLIVMGLLGGGM